jgi:CRP-like cAMP-binding protein
MGLPMSMAAIRSHLGAVALFADIGQPELDRLAAAARFVTYRKHARIFEEGSSAECCYLLTAGHARVVLNCDDGDEVLLAEIQPGDLVGELALLDGCARSAALVAAELCHLIVIPAPAFQLLRANKAFEQRLVSQVTSALRDRSEQVRRVATTSSVARVAWCLGRIASREGRREGRIVVIPRKRHQELAGMAGCTRETVSRALSVLKRKQCLSWDAAVMRLQIDGLRRYIRLEGADPPAAPRSV